MRVHAEFLRYITLVDTAGYSEDYSRSAATIQAISEVDGWIYLTRWNMRDDHLPSGFFSFFL